jgi:F-type H+-transporting ATPase subunit alpha
VLSIFAGTRGLLDDVPLRYVARFEAAMIKHFRDEHEEILEELDSKKDISEALAERITAVIREFKTHAQERVRQEEEAVAAAQAAARGEKSA